MQRGNIEARKIYTVESAAAVAHDRPAAYTVSSEETSFGERDATGALPTEEMTLEQVRMPTTILK